jgi:hypothetical protein
MITLRIGQPFLCGITVFSHDIGIISRQASIPSALEELTELIRIHRRK